MKKILLLLFVFSLSVVSASAQFEEGKKYVGASLSGLDMNYSGNGKFSLGVEGKAGYFFSDNLMLLGEAGYDHQGNRDNGDAVHVGVGARYYITQNGIFLGANCKLMHFDHNLTIVSPSSRRSIISRVSRTILIFPRSALRWDLAFIFDAAISFSIITACG